MKGGIPKLFRKEQVPQEPWLGFSISLRCLRRPADLHTPSPAKVIGLRN